MLSLMVGGRASFFLAALAFISSICSALAGSHYNIYPSDLFWLPEGQQYDPKLGCRVPPPPARDSAEEREDFVVLHDWQDKRTPEECARADSENKITFSVFFGKPNGTLSAPEIATLSKIFEKTQLSAGEAADAEKKRWRRPRPFVTDPRIRPCVYVSPLSLAYPSGHTTIAATFGYVLSHLMPERSSEFEARADQIALDRVIGGVHHPSDIRAGKICAAQLFEALSENPEYLHDFNEAKDALNDPK
jgi:acid phosphatase (class A)